MSKPYTYLIGWSLHDKWYYGVRYTSGCHPNELWVNYFTSSKYVTQYRIDYGEPDVIQVRKTFVTSKQALLWEEKVLRKMNVLKSDRWLNRNIGGAKFRAPLSPSIETRIKLSKAAKGKLVGNTNPMFGMTGDKNPNYKNYWDEEKKTDFSERRKGKRNPNYGKRWSEEKRKTAGRSGKDNPMFGRTGTLNANFGNKTKWTCPVCNKTGGISAMKGHHGSEGEKCLKRFSDINIEEIHND